MKNYYLRSASKGINKPEVIRGILCTDWYGWCLNSLIKYKMLQVKKKL